MGEVVGNFEFNFIKWRVNPFSFILYKSTLRTWINFCSLLNVWTVRSIHTLCIVYQLNPNFTMLTTYAVSIFVSFNSINFFSLWKWLLRCRTWINDRGKGFCKQYLFRVITSQWFTSALYDISLSLYLSLYIYRPSMFIVYLNVIGTCKPLRTYYTQSHICHPIPLLPFQCAVRFYQFLICPLFYRMNGEEKLRSYTKENN